MQMVKIVKETSKGCDNIFQICLSCTYNWHPYEIFTKSEHLIWAHPMEGKCAHSTSQCVKTCIQGNTMDIQTSEGNIHKTKPSLKTIFLLQPHLLYVMVVMMVNWIMK